MRIWEEDEARKIQEEGIRSPFTQWRTMNGEVFEEGLNLGRLYEELRRLGRDRHTKNQVQEQVDREWQPDEWIQTSVWILEEIGGGYQEGVAHLRSVGLRVYPTVYTA
jgi:branched-subunit amino acid aminotransferase/4-amino-4-deoxychorismate lyase